MDMVGMLGRREGRGEGEEGDGREITGSSPVSLREGGSGDDPLLPSSWEKPDL